MGHLTILQGWEPLYNTPCMDLGPFSGWPHRMCPEPGVPGGKQSFKPAGTDPGAFPWRELSGKGLRGSTRRQGRCAVEAMACRTSWAQAWQDGREFGLDQEWSQANATAFVAAAGLT